MSIFQTTRGSYDYNMILINANNNEKEILSVIAHELGHEYMTLHTNLGQLCWLANNLAYNDKKFKSFYEYIFSRINKNEEQFCLILEIFSQILQDEFRNIEAIIDSFQDKMGILKASHSYPFFYYCLTTMSKENFLQRLSLIRTIFTCSMDFEISELTIEDISPKNCVSFFERNKINPKKKLKKIIKYCGDARTIEEFSQVEKEVYQRFSEGNRLPNPLFSVTVNKEDIVLDYRAETNPLVHQLQKEGKSPFLADDLITSSLVAGLLKVLSEQQNDFALTNVFDRMLLFSDSSDGLNKVRVLKKSEELEDILSHTNQLTFTIPYISSYEGDNGIRHIFEESHQFLQFKILGRNIRQNANEHVVNVSGDFILDKISKEKLLTIKNKDKSIYLKNELNILVRMNHTNNSLHYLKKIKRNILEKEEWVNLFICNPKYHIQKLLNEIKQEYGESVYRYIYNDVSVLELYPLRIRLFLLVNDLEWTPGPFTSKPEKEMNVLVTVFLDYIYNGDILSSHLENKKLLFDIER